MRINEFLLHFDGKMKVSEERTDFDLTYDIDETTFKNVLSLLPKVFRDESLDELEAEGKIVFQGHLKGPLTVDRVPAFGLQLGIREGRLHYPDLPTAVNNIAIDLKIDNEDS